MIRVDRHVLLITNLTVIIAFFCTGFFSQLYKRKKRHDTAAGDCKLIISTLW